MYEAIVFLPLLGAIIAGAISLIGASHRHPGEDPPPPHDDHAAPLVPAPHAPIPETAPQSRVERSDSENDESAERDAGSRTAELITTTFLVISWLLSCVPFFEVGLKGHDARGTLFNFITSGDLQ